MKVIGLLPVSEEGKEHDEANFDAVDVNYSVFGRNVSELKGMSQRPDLPRPQNCSEDILVNLQ